MHLLLTGCAGFIGSKVSELLLDQGHSVVGIDYWENAYDEPLKNWRLDQLQQRDKFTFYKIDISKRDLIPNAVGNEAFDGVINLAAKAGVRDSLLDPWLYYETNLIGTLNLLDFCKEHGIQKFILSSTSSVYGDGMRPFKEDAEANQILSPYAASKKAAENLCYSYHHNYELDISILRYFTVYGSAGRPDMAIYRFVSWICDGSKLLLYGDGTQERDFTHVTDVAKGTIMALKKLGFEIINLGSDRPVTVNQVIELIEKYVGKRADIYYQTASTADVQATWADISKARRVLGWKPEVTLEDGLNWAVNWHAENHNWARKLCTAQI